MRAKLEKKVGKVNKEELIEFEDEIKVLWEAGKIHCPVHFCGGNEDQLISYFQKVKPDDWIFSTWRSAYHWLLHTGDAEFLRRKILVDNNSMHIIDLDRRFISTAIVGGNCAPAVGTAYAIKIKGGTSHVHCFIGDGGCDQGWFWEALRYAVGQDLPITFIIENNNRSVCTDVDTRWGAFDMEMCPEAFKDSSKIYYYEYLPTYPHVGTGKWVNW
jgi:pyruvate dehydrogenase E1 component alpha subunit